MTTASLEAAAAPWPAPRRRRERAAELASKRRAVWEGPPRAPGGGGGRRAEALEALGALAAGPLLPPPPPQTAGVHTREVRRTVQVEFRSKTGEKRRVLVVVAGQQRNSGNLAPAEDHHVETAVAVTPRLPRPVQARPLLPAPLEVVPRRRHRHHHRHRHRRDDRHRHRDEVPRQSLRKHRYDDSLRPTKAVKGRSSERIRSSRQARSMQRVRSSKEARLNKETRLSKEARSSKEARTSKQARLRKQTRPSMEVRSRKQGRPSKEVEKRKSSRSGAKALQSLVVPDLDLSQPASPEIVRADLRLSGAILLPPLFAYGVATIVPIPGLFWVILPQLLIQLGCEVFLGGNKTAHAGVSRNMLAATILQALTAVVFVSTLLTRDLTLHAVFKLVALGATACVGRAMFQLREANFATPSSEEGALLGKSNIIIKSDVDVSLQGHEGALARSVPVSTRDDADLVDVEVIPLRFRVLASLVVPPVLSIALAARLPFSGILSVSVAAPLLTRYIGAALLHPEQSLGRDEGGLASVLSTVGVALSLLNPLAYLLVGLATASSALAAAVSVLIGFIAYATCLGSLSTQHTLAAARAPAIAETSMTSTATKALQAWAFGLTFGLVPILFPVLYVQAHRGSDEDILSFVSSAHGAGAIGTALLCIPPGTLGLGALIRGPSASVYSLIFPWTSASGHQGWLARTIGVLGWISYLLAIAMFASGKHEDVDPGEHVLAAGFFSWVLMMTSLFLFRPERADKVAAGSQRHPSGSIMAILFEPHALSIRLGRFISAIVLATGAMLFAVALVLDFYADVRAVRLVGTPLVICGVTGNLYVTHSFVSELAPAGRLRLRSLFGWGLFATSMCFGWATVLCNFPGAAALSVDAMCSWLELKRSIAMTGLLGWVAQVMVGHPLVDLARGARRVRRRQHHRRRSRVKATMADAETQALLSPSTEDDGGVAAGEDEVEPVSTDDDVDRRANVPKHEHTDGMEDEEDEKEEDDDDDDDDESLGEYGLEESGDEGDGEDVEEEEEEEEEGEDAEAEDDDEDSDEDSYYGGSYYGGSYYGEARPNASVEQAANPGAAPVAVNEEPREEIPDISSDEEDASAADDNEDDEEAQLDRSPLVSPPYSPLSQTSGQPAHEGFRYASPFPDGILGSAGVVVLPIPVPEVSLHDLDDATTGSELGDSPNGSVLSPFSIHSLPTSDEEDVEDGEKEEDETHEPGLASMLKANVADDDQFQEPAAAYDVSVKSDQEQIDDLAPNSPQDPAIPDVAKEDSAGHAATGGDEGQGVQEVGQVTDKPDLDGVGADNDAKVEEASTPSGNSPEAVALRPVTMPRDLFADIPVGNASSDDNKGEALELPGVEEAGIDEGDAVGDEAATPKTQDTVLDTLEEDAGEHEPVAPGYEDASHLAEAAPEDLAAEQTDKEEVNEAPHGASPSVVAPLAEILDHRGDSESDRESDVADEDGTGPDGTAEKADVFEDAASHVSGEEAEAQDAPAEGLQDAPADLVQNAPAGMMVQDGPANSVQDVPADLVQEAPPDSVQEASADLVQGAPAHAVQGTPADSPDAARRVAPDLDVESDADDMDDESVADPQFVRNDALWQDQERTEVVSVHSAPRSTRSDTRGGRSVARATFWSGAEEEVVDEMHVPLEVIGNYQEGMNSRPPLPLPPPLELSSDEMDSLYSLSSSSEDERAEGEDEVVDIFARDKPVAGRMGTPFGPRVRKAAGNNGGGKTVVAQAHPGNTGATARRGSFGSTALPESRSVVERPANEVEVALNLRIKVMVDVEGGGAVSGVKSVQAEVVSQDTVLSDPREAPRLPDVRRAFESRETEESDFGRGEDEVEDEDESGVVHDEEEEEDAGSYSRETSRAGRVFEMLFGAEGSLFGDDGDGEDDKSSSGSSSVRTHYGAAKTPLPVEGDSSDEDDSSDGDYRSGDIDDDNTVVEGLAVIEEEEEHAEVPLTPPRSRRASSGLSGATYATSERVFVANPSLSDDDEISSEDLDSESLFARLEEIMVGAVDHGSSDTDGEDDEDEEAHGETRDAKTMSSE